MWACFRFRAFEEFQRGRVISIQGRGRAKKRHAIISLLQHRWTVSDNYNHWKLIFCALFWISDRLALQAKLQKQDSCGVGGGEGNTSWLSYMTLLDGTAVFCSQILRKTKAKCTSFAFHWLPCNLQACHDAQGKRVPYSCSIFISLVSFKRKVLRSFNNQMASILQTI